MVFTLLAYALAFALAPALFWDALENTWMYVREMLEILPAVFVLTGLITVWVPPRVIIDNFGGSSGLRGKLISVLIGSVSAGPIYAAFPFTHSLLHKGASLANVVIMISAWAVVKLPMLIVESRFLGIHFTAVRFLFTVPAILAIGAMVGARTSREGVMAVGPVDESPVDTHGYLREVLTGVNCGACGYASCSEFARALHRGDADIDECNLADEETKEKVRHMLRIG